MNYISSDRILLLVKKWSSFQRQLNIYGFHKVRGGYDADAFFHPFFSKNVPEGIFRVDRVPVKGVNRNGSNPSSCYYNLIDGIDESSVTRKLPQVHSNVVRQEDSSTSTVQVLTKPILDFKCDGNRFEWIVSSPKLSYYSQDYGDPFLHRFDQKQDPVNMISVSDDSQEEKIPAILIAPGDVVISDDEFLDLMIASEGKCDPVNETYTGSILTTGVVNHDSNDFNDSEFTDLLDLLFIEEALGPPMEGNNFIPPELATSQQSLMEKDDSELIQLLNFITRDFE